MCFVQGGRDLLLVRLNLTSGNARGRVFDNGQQKYQRQTLQLLAISVSL